MKRNVKTIILMLFVSAIAMAQVNDDYSTALSKMFKVSGSEESYSVVITQMMTMYKQQYTDVEASMWDDLEKEFFKTSMDDLVVMLAPVYEKHMTLDDINAMIDFYETPVGKKFAKSTPMIIQESMQVGQKWGMKVAEDFQKTMKEKGY